MMSSIWKQNLSFCTAAAPDFVLKKHKGKPVVQFYCHQSYVWNTHPEEPFLTQFLWKDKGTNCYFNASFSIKIFSRVMSYRPLPDR